MEKNFKDLMIIGLLLCCSLVFGRSNHKGTPVAPPIPAFQGKCFKKQFRLQTPTKTNFTPQTPTPTPKYYHTTTPTPTPFPQLNHQPCLNMHSDARKNAGLPALNWDYSLANSAAQYAKKLSSLGYLTHSGGGEQMNLYMGSTSCTDAVRLWLDERKNYHGQRIVAPSNYGHFTQILNPNAKKVGCGEYKGYVACKYDNIQTTGSVLKNY
jgi:uncharacterized protein YkwD